MAKQNQKPETKKKTIKTIKTRNQKNKKNDKTQLSATTPPLGVCSLVFFGGVLGFLVSYFLVRCFFFLQWLTRPKTKKTRNENNTKPKKRTIPKNKIVDIYIYITLFMIYFDIYKVSI